jgi:Tol biopolymer transport system component
MLERGAFDIAVVDLGTRQVLQITQGRGSCEYPAWAPNGRHLAFSCKRGRVWQITISDRDGRNVQGLSTGPGNNVQPDWGP